MIKNLMFLGAPGVGKGTLAAEIAEAKGLVHISTGEIFRENIKNETELGLKVKAIIAAGEYVPDDVTNQIVKAKLAEKEIQEKGFILDGFPRTTAQAEFLKENGITLDKVVLLTASDEEVIKRLLGRGRADDNEETIKTRIEVYNKSTMPLIDFYKNEGNLIEVCAEGTIDENVQKALGAIFND